MFTGLVKLSFFFVEFLELLNEISGSVDLRSYLVVFFISISLQTTSVDR